MNLVGIISILLSIYFYVSFESQSFVINPIREVCSQFGDASGFVCLYLGAVNWFIVCLFAGVGYACLTYKVKQVQQPCV
jgi:hypothetical protein